MSEDESRKIFAENLKRLIDESGKTRKEVAEATGIKYATLSEWINQRKYPRIDKIEILSNYFGVKKSSLIEAKDFKLEKMQTIAAHATRDLTEDEINKVMEYVSFLKSQRK